jgi:hypothetical protein
LTTINGNFVPLVEKDYHQIQIILPTALLVVLVLKTLKNEAVGNII